MRKLTALRKPTALKLTALWVGLAASGLLAGCGAAAPDSSAEAALNAQQAQLSAQARRSLGGRTCADLPDRGRLQGLPDVSLACLGTGPARQVRAGDGRPTVINLWASWCAPCVTEMPMLQRTAGRVGPGVRFVGIDVQDETGSAASLLQATGVRYDQYADPDGKIRSAVRAVGLPVTLVYDARGREVARRFGAIRGSWLDDALRAATAAPAEGG